MGASGEWEWAKGGTNRCASHSSDQPRFGKLVMRTFLTFALFATPQFAGTT